MDDELATESVTAEFAGSTAQGWPEQPVSRRRHRHGSGDHANHCVHIASPHDGKVFGASTRPVASSLTDSTIGPKRLPHVERPVKVIRADEWDYGSIVGRVRRRCSRHMRLIGERRQRVECNVDNGSIALVQHDRAARRQCADQHPTRESRREADAATAIRRQKDRDRAADLRGALPR